MVSLIPVVKFKQKILLPLFNTYVHALWEWVKASNSCETPDRRIASLLSGLNLSQWKHLISANDLMQSYVSAASFLNSHYALLSHNLSSLCSSVLNGWQFSSFSTCGRQCLAHSECRKPLPAGIWTISYFSLIMKNLLPSCILRWARHSNGERKKPAAPVIIKIGWKTCPR